MLLIGCESRMAPPEKDGPPYQGPPIRLDDSGPTLTVVFTAPTPGWQVHLNRIEEGFQTRDVLITIVEPNPQFHYAQSLVEQRVATTVTADLTARVFVRHAPHAPIERIGGAYSHVASRKAIPDERSK